MGNCPASFLYCAHCDKHQPLPFRQPPRFYLGYVDGTAEQAAALQPQPQPPLSAAVPQCLGYCSDCQRYTAVEDFSQSLPALEAQLAAAELALTELAASELAATPHPQQQQSRLPAVLARYWPPARRRQALQHQYQQQLQQLQQQVQALALLLHIRQQPNRQPRCLTCASHAITAYPAYPYTNSGFLADLPEDLLHHCNNRLTSGMAPLDPDGPLFSVHIRTAPLYYAVDGWELDA